MKHSALIDTDDTFVLSDMDLYNWGPFGGRHHFSIHPEGTAIVGPTGSGKTTIIDALMTLIVPRPSYNLASSGGHESDDRTLMSYLRGDSGGGDGINDATLASRPGKTITGLCVTLDNGHKKVRLATLIWMDSGSRANADRRDLWFFCENNDTTLDDLLRLHHEGGVRRIKKIAEEIQGLHVHGTKKHYLAQVRRHFEVGENAFTLLNRAAGLKQLNSVDEIFRELVLDDHSKFVQALEVAKTFDVLTTIHEELIIAKKQQTSLQPLESLNRRYCKQGTRKAELEQLEQLLPAWFGQEGARLWCLKHERLDAEIKEMSSAIDTADRELEHQKSVTEYLQGLFIQQGGADIKQIEKTIELCKKLLGEKRQKAASYQQLVANLQTSGLKLMDDLTASSFHSNRETASAHQRELVPFEQNKQEAVDEARARLHASKENLQKLEEELEEVKARPDSNVPASFQRFRQDLCEAIDLDEKDLPFIAELLEVKVEHRAWRGAIERALGGHRLRLLVPEGKLRTALVWVNDRHNLLHVRLMEAKAKVGEAKFMEDGFARMLNFKPHPLLDPVKALIADIDRHCVADTETLRNTLRAMTMQGTMSGRSGQFEKRDKRPLDSDWFTGFSNKDLLSDLTQRYQDEKTTLKSCQLVLEGQDGELKQVQTKSKSLSLLLECSFDKVDTQPEERELEDSQKRRDELVNPQSESAKAKQQYEEARKKLDEMESQRRELGEQRSVLSSQQQGALKHLKESEARMGNLSEEEQQIAERYFHKVSDPTALEKSENEAQKKLHGELDDIRLELGELKTKIVRQMGKAKECDTGSLVELEDDVRDIDGYLGRLRILNLEALPEKRERFLSYLNQSSDQGVNQLLSEIDNEVGRIKERISQLNTTLDRVDYQDGRILQLIPQSVQHESLRELDRARTSLRSARLIDEQEGESHYAALKKVVDILREKATNRNLSGARAMLDPRYRLQFAFETVDRDTKQSIDRRTSSKGGSGGEKEIIASYILTASLSYALCPDDSPNPLFGTVVLDEAFSKSSQTVAAKIIAALKEFGLHALFVTPNKEMQLLRKHTRSAVLVHRKDFQSVLTEMSWEEIDERLSKNHDTQNP